MKWRATLATASLTCGLVLMGPADDALARVNCVHLVSHGKRTFHAIDDVKSIGPIPLVIIIDTVVKTNVGYRWCIDKRTRAHWVVPEFYHIHWYPVNAKFEGSYTCHHFRAVEADLKVIDGTKKVLNTPSIQAKCYPNASGGYQFYEMEVDKRFHAVKGYGWPRYRVDLKQVIAYMPDQNIPTVSKHLNPFEL